MRSSKINSYRTRSNFRNIDKCEKKARKGHIPVFYVISLTKTCLIQDSAFFVEKYSQVTWGKFCLYRYMCHVTNYENALTISATVIYSVNLTQALVSYWVCRLNYYKPKLFLIDKLSYTSAGAVYIANSYLLTSMIILSSNQLINKFNMHNKVAAGL